VILDLGACPNCDLEARSGIRLEMEKIRFFEKFDREWTFLYRGRISILEVGVGL